ncbi:hypothetical protein ACKKBG_A28285 [Auxenochlorella protothecoides x Auxenochlorella symbiontica]
MVGSPVHTLDFGADIMDVGWHPSRSLLAGALISGSLHLHTISEEGVSSLNCVEVFPGASLRALTFPSAHSSEVVLAASSEGDLALVAVETGQVSSRLPTAHDGSLTCARPLNGSMVACGDEGGSVKVWDLRSMQAVHTWTPHGDYVSGMTWHEPQQSLLSVSGDGTLARMDPRAKKVKNKSDDDVDDELLSVVVVKSGRKVVCGTTTGVLNIWSWGYWNDCSDRFPGHPESVEAMVKLDEDTIVTGSSDGMLRVVSLQPNKLVGVLGEHADYPIERLALRSDGQMLASASHDQTVKLWDLADEEESEEEGGKKEEEGAMSKCLPAEEGRGGVLEGAEASASPEADALGSGSSAEPGSDEGPAEGASEGGDSSEESSSSDEGDAWERKRRRGKGAHRIPSKQVAKKQSSGAFFADL